MSRGFAWLLLAVLLAAPLASRSIEDGVDAAAARVDATTSGVGAATEAEPDAIVPAPAAARAVADADAGAGAEKETIVIRAHRAWEDPEDEDVLHFQGDFELRSEDFRLSADEADLYGPLDDPERIVARGEPAVVVIVDDDESTTGRGRTIEYERAADLLTLRGEAELDGRTLAMRSAEIVFDLDARRLKSSGDSGVEMILQRERRRPSGEG